MSVREVYWFLTIGWALVFLAWWVIHHGYIVGGLVAAMVGTGIHIQVMYYSLTGRIHE